MPNEIINIIFFGLGLAFQARTFIGSELKKEDLKQIIIDICAGLFFILLLSGGIIRSIFVENDSVNGYSLLFYSFYIGFGTAFTLSFRDRLFSHINEVSLFAINTVFLYYLITKGGYNHPFTVIFYIPTAMILLLILFKNKLEKYQKCFILIWYLFISILVGVINWYFISHFPENSSYSLYVSKFFSGGIFLYIYVFMVYMLTIIPMTGRGRGEIKRGEREGKERFLLLVSSFNKTNLNSFLSLSIFVILIAVLISNYYYKFISEHFVVAFVMFSAAYLNSKISSPIILNNNVPENK